MQVEGLHWKPIRNETDINFSDRYLHDVENSNDIIFEKLYNIVPFQNRFKPLQKFNRKVHESAEDAKKLLTI